MSGALKRVEISVRSRWAYVLGHAGGPQAFEDGTLFSNTERHAEAMEQFDKELGRSCEVFIRHFRDNYRMPRPRYGRRAKSCHLAC